ncbi:Tetratricopeptide repeat-containing protein [Quadrisphaera granulorum]|uniref:Tetratricopeptide repeat protein n=1 Tax=Quadrisphaera granulorum TaxID=317664 RepID=A0A316A7D7_9ACTN|nr:tetratricopeptide repeat protein [Quadrisphaera granulorum]PWJ52734.1 tetratricopeptide repeat protein [Quadrisphaera granulorum]SZE97556.1 Tetratricopeptide repeat-containing protein [Quadrisphaera granulorum]
MDADSEHDRGVDAAEAGRFEEAAEAFARAVALGDRDALLGLGNALLDLGRDQEAETAFARAVDQGDPLAGLNLGIARERLEDWAGAERAYQEARRAGDPRALVFLADVWRWHGGEPGVGGGEDDARDLLRTAAAAGDAEAAAVLGTWMFSELTRGSADQGGGDEAVAALPVDSEVEQLLRAGAGYDDDARGDLAWLLRVRGVRRGDRAAHAEALQLLRAGAAAGDPTSAIRLSLALEEDLGDLDGAEAVLRALAEGGEPRAWNNLGLLLERRGRIVEARRVLSRGVRAGDVLAAKNLRSFLVRHHPAQVAEGTAPL